MNKLIPGLGALLLLAFSLAGCGDPDDTGSLLLPGRDLQYSDTTELSLETVPVDTLITAARTFVNVGRLNDPDFGVLEADAFVQFDLLNEVTETFVALQNKTCTGVVLNFAIQAPYGVAETELQFQAHPLTEDMSLTREEDSLTLLNPYTVSDSIAYDAATPLADNQTFSAPADVSRNALTSVTLELSPSYGQQLLDQLENYVGARDSFKNFFKGLHLAALPGVLSDTGVVHSIPFSSMQFRLGYSYDNDSVTGLTDTIEFRVLDNNSARFSRIRRSETSGTLFEQIQNDPAGLGQEFLQLQAGNLLQINSRLLLPDSLPNQALNRAELVLPLDSSSLADTGTFPLPIAVSLHLLQQDSQAVDFSLPVIISSTYQPEQQAYVFILTRYVRQLMDGGLANVGFAVVSADVRVTVDRAIFTGPQHPDNPPKLRLFTVPLDSN